MSSAPTAAHSKNISQDAMSSAPTAVYSENIPQGYE